MLYNTDHLLTANIDYFPYKDKCPYKEIDLCHLSVKMIYVSTKPRPLTHSHLSM